MIHLVDKFTGQIKNHQGQILNGYATLCGIQFGQGVKLLPGTEINIGTRDGQRCPECFAHQKMNNRFSSKATFDEEGRLLGRAVEDISDPRDHGRAIVRESGYGSKLIKTEISEGGEDGRLGGYEETYTAEDRGGMGQPLDDPYGELAAAEQLGREGKPCRYPEGTPLYKAYMRGRNSKIPRLF